MMTRDEFMDHANRELENAFRTYRNRMMNLIEQSWAEGKKNAETEAMIAAVKDALKNVPTQPYPYPVYPYYSATPTITCEGTKPPEAHYSGEGTL